MLNYITKRIVLAFLTITVISFVSFIVMQLPPGDYVDWYLRTSEEREHQPRSAEVLRQEFGLNKPLISQWWDWYSSILFSGNFTGGVGETPTAGILVPIKYMFSKTLPPTILIALSTMIVTWLLAIPIGIYSAVRQNSVGDYVFSAIGFSGLAVPDFLLGLILMYLLYAYFELSVGGLYSAHYVSAPWRVGKVVDLLQHLIVPTIVIGTAGVASIVRILRNNLLDELTKPYVVTARAKGISEWRVVLKYPLRLAIGPLISGMAYILPNLLSGTIIVSVVLGLPTLGPLMLDGLEAQNMGVVSAIILVMGSLTVIGTLISDLLLIIVDPRIRLI